MSGSGHTARVAALAGLLATAGVLHFARPEYFDRLVPRQLPGSARSWVLGSGAAELACAATIACPRTREFGAGASAVLFIAVWPGNIKMAIKYSKAGKPAWQQAVAWARLPLQWPLIRTARTIRQTAHARSVDQRR